ncbi:MAG: BON domain-containing protein [Xanthomonadales bacterium]|nr:BON domain-containing protein [Xanthomonadales bacterium]
MHSQSIRRAFALVAALALAGPLLGLVGCASTRTSEGTGEYIDDVVITTKVRSAIFNEADLSAAEINVETFKGRVQLSGFVSTREEIERAGRIARGIAGVTSVVNDIRIK